MKSTTVVLLLISLGTASTAGADGMLDPSFGNGGKVTTAFGGMFSQDSALSLVMQPDGRAVAAGQVIPNLATTWMGAARYLTTGALDTTFDGDGMVTVQFPPPPGMFDVGVGAHAVLLQPDGRLVLVGHMGASPPPFSGFAVARLNGDGALDTSFGTGGRVVTQVPLGTQVLTGLLQPDGRIVVIGQVSATVIAARYNANGSLDSTFGNGGIATPGLPQDMEVDGAALQPDGKIVIVGASPFAFLQRNFALLRLLPNGTLDLSFDGDGLATADFGQIETGASVIVLPDGRLVLTGWRSPTTSNYGDFALVRFLADGALDTTFGNAGLAIADSGDPDRPHQLIRLPNGNLLVAGSTALTGAPADFLLARFLPDGALDTSFGTAGLLRTDFNASQDEATGVALAGPDLILAAGTAGGGLDSDFGLARYIAATPVELLRFAVE